MISREVFVRTEEDEDLYSQRHWKNVDINYSLLVNGGVEN